MKVIVAGSRDLIVTVDAIRAEADRTGWAITEVVSGAAPGVDRCGEDFARYYQHGLRKFPADWKAHGKAAGSLRNKEMADYADAALVFCRDRPTPGSSNMAAWMLALEKPVRVVLTATPRSASAPWPASTPGQVATFARYMQMGAAEMQLRVMRGEEDDRLIELLNMFEAYFALCRAKLGHDYVPVATWETYVWVKDRLARVKNAGT